VTDDEQVARWQEKLDREFPSGLVSYFEPGKVNYFVSRVIVVRMAGLDPVVWLPVFSGSVKTFGPAQVLSYEQFRNSPRAVRVRFDNEKRPMVWSAALPPEAVRLMAPDRAQFIEAAPHGGERVLKGDPEK
jgi:hypothetical protein